MEKSIYALAALGTLMFASCSNEELPAPVGTDGTVTFTAKLPAAMSRAYGDGTQTKQLSYAVYDATDGTTVFATDDVATSAPAPVKVSETEFTLTLNLVKGKTYDFIFWADAATGSPYTFSSADKSVTVSYQGVVNNDESRDAFFQSVAGLAVGGPMQQSVELRRPFAQLNVGTSDIAAAAAAKTEVDKVAVTVKGVYSALNLFTGIASEPVDVNFAAAAMPGTAFTIDGTDYDYLAMDYLLTGAVLETEGGDVQKAQRELMDASVLITFADGQSTTVEVPNMPVQRNYRTNVYGALLTSPLDLEIVVVPEFFEPDNDLGAPVAPGVMLDAAAKTYTISAPEGLVWVSEQSNGVKDAFKGYTVKLGADLDMTGIDFTPIARGQYFGGTLDGDGHTIANLTAFDPDCAGLVWSNRGTIKNLTMTDVNISGNFKAGAIAGDGLCGTFVNCHVDGGTVSSSPRKVGNKYDDGNNVGGITGYLSAESNASITDCSVKNLNLIGYRTIGSIAGTVGGVNAIVSGNSAENCSVLANQLITNYDGYPRAPQAEELFGRLVNGATIGEGNTATAVSTEVLSAPTDGNYQVGNILALKAIESSINAGQSFAGQTITLTADIDANGATWTSKWGNYMKNVTFDGGNHTISNLKIFGGFFPGGVHSGLLVKDVTFKDCDATGDSAGGAIVISHVYGNFALENVHVEGGSVTASWAAGALVGQYTNEDSANYTATFTNCSVSGTTISATAEGWIECEGVAGANAFIGACVAWDIYGTQKEITVNLSDCTASDNVINNAPSVKGGGLYAISKVKSGKPNTLISTTVYND